LGERRTIEEFNGGDNSTNLEKIDLNKKAIHIHAGTKDNLVGYAKYYSCGSIKILGSNEFTKKINRSRRDFSRHW